MADVLQTVKYLPRMPSEAGSITAELKHELQYKKVTKFCREGDEGLADIEAVWSQILQVCFRDWELQK